MDTISMFSQTACEKIRYLTSTFFGPILAMQLWS